ncbi:MAG: sensor histidine kinase [Methylophilus sp.]|uniref:sensor histidine kinase n=1 Tax=Methylophilus sp. TaxID=29541 RepID=UPI003F9F3D70
MKSIHSYLLLSLIAALAIGTLLVALFLYSKSAEEINELYDSNMKELAHVISTQFNAPTSIGSAEIESRMQANRDAIFEEEDFLIQVWNPAGERIYTTHPRIEFPLQAQRKFFTVNYQHQKWRVFTLESAQGVIQISQPQAARHIYIWQLATGLLLPLLLQIPLIGLLIWIAVGRSLKPLDKLSKAIQSRSAASLEHLDIEVTPKEIQPVVNELNSLLTRLENSIALQRNFTANAAHELRTPLAALQLQIDVLARCKNEQERMEAVSALQTGIVRASNLVAQLLTLARLGSEQSTHQSVIELNQIVKPILEAHLDQAAAKNIDVGFYETQPLYLNGNAEAIGIAVRNLIDNAIRYSVDSSKVDVMTYATDSSLVIEIQDGAERIPEPEKQRIFDRFYRGAASHGVSGSGLGLAIVKDVIEQHQGQIRVKSKPDFPGNVFEISFPNAHLPKSPLK